MDDAITEFEKGLSRDVKELRLSDPGTVINAEHAARTVTHLVMRTAHLRNTLSNGVTSLLQEVERMFTDPARLAEMLGFSGPALASSVTGAIRNSAQKLVPAGIPAAFSERLLTFLMRERGAEFAEQIPAVLSPFMVELIGGLAKLVRDSHNDMIAKPLDDHGWVGLLSGFSWKVEAGADLILPDAVALSRAEDGRLEAFLFTRGRETTLVLLPLSTDRMLVGRLDPSETVNLSTFNFEAAAACQGFFISARSRDEEDLANAIGSGPAKAMAEDIADALTNAEKARSMAPSDFAPAVPRKFEWEHFAYQVILHDFGDDILAQEYADVLQVVVGALSRDIPLHDLDGVTIAADYSDALAKIDRGDPDLPPVVSKALAYGVGVAMPVTVMREGKSKKHLVVDAGFAEGWISDKPEEREKSLHLLVSMLAGIANSSRFGEDITFKPDPMSRELHLAVARAPSIYWSAKQAAFVSPSQGASFADLVIDSYEHATAEIARVRSRMSGPSDINDTFLAGLDTVTAVLNHAADWVGHRDGLANGQAFDGDDLLERLAVYGLDNWITLFGRDLGACYTDDGALDLNVVTTLSRHVERLFWSLGICCWPEGGRVRCIIAERGFVLEGLPSVTRI
ncbi:hypothetical protein O4G73_13125 [Erythrobacter sp. G21629-S1]|nr:hypothetical protein [Erythrobacter sp. G21629-S1]